MPKLNIRTQDGTESQIDVATGSLIMEALRDGGLVDATCGGVASCGTCHIYFADAALAGEQTEDEGYMLEGLADFVETEGIDCHYAPVGRFTGATRAEHYEGMARECDLLNKHFDLDAFAVPKSEQHQEIGTDYYHGGVVRHHVAGGTEFLCTGGMHAEVECRDADNPQYEAAADQGGNGIF